MKKTLVAFIVFIIVLCSSTTVYAQTPDLYGKIDYDYDELKELVVDEFYAEKYTDLKEAYGYDSAKLQNHFYVYGLKEERLCNPVLDVQKYKEKYPDLQLAFGNDWDSYVQHYFQYGIYENRDNGTDFDPEVYLKLNPDVGLVYGENNYAGAAKHYLEYGYAENREWEINIGMTYTFGDSDSSSSSSTVNPPTPSLSLPEREDYPNGDYVIREFENDLLSIQTTYSADGTIQYQTYYEYDEAGEYRLCTDYIYHNGVLDIIRESHYENGVNFKDVGYDANNNKVYTCVFQYDAGGTRIGYIEYDADDRKIAQEEVHSDGSRTLTYYDATTGNKTSVDEYDSIGNIISRTVYDAEGNPIP